MIRASNGRLAVRTRTRNSEDRTGSSCAGYNFRCGEEKLDHAG